MPLFKLKQAYRILRATLCASLLLVTSLRGAYAELSLPALGEGGGGVFSPAEEHTLGQAWLRSLRSSVMLFEDPLTYEYLENLLYELASHSALEKRNIDLVVIDNPSLNAFAVPGGVVGIHTGLLDHARSSAQLASVLSHELAHLSQRHFARGVEAARRANFASIAGMLAGIVLAASGSGDAATAAIATSQAAALDSQLRYSRLHEREADRIGMQTMVAAGFPASGAAEMFQQMQAAARLYGEGIPEFLRTHPVTQARIADAENRARGQAGAPKEQDLDYLLVRARVAVLQAEKLNDLIKHYRHELQRNREKIKDAAEPEIELLQQADTARYALALALNRSGQWREARKTLQPLLQDIPGRIAYTLLDIEIDQSAGQQQQAAQRLRDLYAITPNNYAISIMLAKMLMQNEAYTAAQSVLQSLAEARPKQPDVWYLLAEVQGLAGDILQLHFSRAEFFILLGNLTQAQTQLGYALRIAGNDVQVAAKIKQRLREIQQIRRDTERL
ncbi:MAG: M48 family metalloprotease [Gammaproteobacteria bacterium]|nr:M48 family metalloprotease [Gammaproteobacteria bacterium]MBT8151228.1 M48 family metalloprotease [Gammaproteobacteria bacterium]NND39559.1 M48 family metallopeptidase [Pseudomonadales bacterium]NNM10801.1 M48 family metallopeptidase [Pseudomonadales bacterium]